MEDYQIVELYWQRSETAISESDRKYGRMLKKISFSLLSSAEDAEECVSDTYLSAWNRMPSERPDFLGAFLARIVRNISVDRFRRRSSRKRGGPEAVFEELTECVPDGGDVQSEIENRQLGDVINRFVGSLEKEKRVIFVKRYFYCEEIKDIAEEMGLGEGKVKTVLFRLRAALGEILGKEKLL